MSPARLLAPLALALLLPGAAFAQDDALPASPSEGERFAYVRMDTSLGELILELDKQAAPATVENFLAYVNEGFYDGTIFHRVIGDFMAQGGGYEPGLVPRPPTREPVRNESDNGLSNLSTTVAMARTNDPHSATAQFFINLADNSRNLDHKGGDNWGYTVFGKVIEGFDTLVAIKNARVELNPRADANSPAYPLDPIVIQTAVEVPASACADAIAADRARERRAEAAANPPDVSITEEVAAARAEHDDPVHAVIAALGHDPAQLQTRASGLGVVEITPGSGDSPDSQTIVQVHYTGWLLNGQAFDSSRARGEPLTISLDRVIPAWTEGVSEMRVGGRQLLVAPAELAYGDGSSTGGVIPPDATLVFDVELLAIKDYASVEQGKALLEEKGVDVSAGRTTPSGLFFVDEVVGEGATPARTDKVLTHYSGWLVDGTPFDSSIERGQPAAFGVGQVIKGWTEALTTMQVGGTRWVVIPYELAYGAAGRPPVIPPRAALVFEMRLLEIQ